MLAMAFNLVKDGYILPSPAGPVACIYGNVALRILHIFHHTYSMFTADPFHRASYSTKKVESSKKDMQKDTVEEPRRPGFPLDTILDLMNRTIGLHQG